VHAALRGKPYYERGVDAGMLRACKTVRTFKTMLTRFVVGIDTGVADLMSMGANVWRERGDTVQWSDARLLDRADYHLRCELGVADGVPLDEDCSLTPAQVDALLEHFELVMRADRVRGRGTDYSSRGAQRMSTAAAEAAAARRATGERDDATHVPLLANALQAVRDGEPAKLRRHNKRFLAKAAERPVHAVRRVLDALGVAEQDAAAQGAAQGAKPALTDRQIRDRIVIVVGNPTFGATHRGHRASPAKKLVLELARRFQTFVVNEYMTSQRCAKCGAPTEQTRDGVVRFRHCTAEHAQQAPARGDNKDFNAMMAMARIAVHLWIHGERPVQWQKPKDKAVAAAAAAPKKKTKTTTKRGAGDDAQRQGVKAARVSSAGRTSQSKRLTGKRHAADDDAQRTNVKSRRARADDDDDEFDPHEDASSDSASSQRGGSASSQRR